MAQSFQFKIDFEHTRARLDIFLSEMLENVPSRTFIKKLIDHGCVTVNEESVKAGHRLKEGDDVWVDIPERFLTPEYAEPENIDLDIFYEDECLLIINKPCGMTVHPGANCHSGTLVNALLYHCKELSSVGEEFRPGIVHRLDKETSGLILVAKDNITHAKLAKQFQQHQVRKQYLALVKGRVEFDEGRIEQPLGKHVREHDKRSVRYDEAGKEAITFYKVLKRAEDRSLVALFPQTGRTHQLRVHMAYMHHPILGDEKYGDKRSFPRLALHAQAIRFRHPKTNHYVEFSSIPPFDL